MGMAGVMVVWYDPGRHLVKAQSCLHADAMESRHGYCCRAQQKGDPRPANASPHCHKQKQRD